MAAAAANVAAEGLSPRTARVEAEAAASLSMSLAENALVLLMLVEDHLRLESQYYYSTISLKSAMGSGPILPTLSNVPSRRHSAIGIEISLPSSDNSNSRRLSTTPDTGGLSLQVCGSCLSIVVELPHFKHQLFVLQKLFCQLLLSIPPSLLKQVPCY